MKILIPFAIIISLLSTGCKNGPSTVQVQTTRPSGYSAGGITPDMTDQLLKTADHIDYIFSTIPLSMNQEGQSSVYQDLRFLSSKPLPGMINGCQPLARKIYLGNGEIIVEADLYFSNGCFYQIFISEEKALYGNYLSAEGLDYYVKLMDQAKQSMPAEFRNAYQLPDINLK